MPVYRERPLEAPYAGMWIPDDLENAIERHFEEGEVFPDRGEYYKYLQTAQRKLGKAIVSGVWLNGTMVAVCCRLQSFNVPILLRRRFRRP